MTQLNGLRPKYVGILIENQFEDSEFQVPYNALKEAEIHTSVIGTRMNETYQGKRGQVSIQPDVTATEVRAEDFDAILIPGGNAPDLIRSNDNAVRLIMDAVAQGKLIATVCHGIQVLIEADVLRGKHVTGFRSIRKDVENAGALYLNQPIVRDGNIITARQPSDLPIFTAFLLGCLGTVIPEIPFIEVGEFFDKDSISASDFEWWELGHKWGGSSRADIIDALNQAIIGERYTLEAFKQYSQSVIDQELRLIFQNAIATKKYNLELLEARLSKLGESTPWQATASEAYAVLQNWLQFQDGWEIVRRALGDLQTGVVDALRLCTSITDPKTAEILDLVQTNLAKHEQRLASFYRGRMGEKVKSPMPTTASPV
ncbi:MAG: type 1 glutamine amidotransferase domain-containing protein [Calothrix sp. MO_167.B12]|nr:type 1 glutamine amidotransferase domain-containing protein [Calothrix sp. MO_167.B12]